MRWEDRYEQNRFEIKESYRIFNQEEFVEGTLIKEPGRSIDGTAGVRDVASSKLRERRSIFTSEIRGPTAGIRTDASPAWYAPYSTAHGPAALWAQTVQIWTAANAPGDAADAARAGFPASRFSAAYARSAEDGGSTAIAGRSSCTITAAEDAAAAAAASAF